ncbi:hypothetical protein [uncultured Eubacterium sp.]|uniref:hypothetical protein n=1 Tax=uncultured Eubacterium sp. TaxID=165185 RepID=UPI0026748DCB|nr:hypothetical protein [uncultured Eubacterium sp.]
MRKMLNIEKYKEILIDTGVINITKLAVINDKPVECRECQCGECDFGGKGDCKPYIEEWLFSEYEEPEEPEVDWSKVEVDTPIYVRDSVDDEWKPRYFAKYIKGEGICAWDFGTTSFSSGNESNYNVWNYAKLAESEE